MAAGNNRPPHEELLLHGIPKDGSSGTREQAAS